MAHGAHDLVMRYTNFLHLAFAFLFACSSVHTPGGEPDPDPETDPDPDPIAALEACLAGGGALEVVASVDNDDITEHGDVITLAVDPSGTIAVSTVDGTIKLWSLESGFVGERSTRELLYGTERSSAIAADLVYYEGWLVAGDQRGVVTGWTDDGTQRVFGGTIPDLAITAVAIDAERDRLAHADASEGGGVVVRGLESGEHFGPFATSLSSVRDLAFTSDGSLLLAGGSEHGGAIELRAGSDLAGEPLDFAAEGAAFAEIAAARDVIAAVSANRLVILDASLAPSSDLDVSDRAPTSISLSPDGHLAFTANGDGSLDVRDTDGGSVLGSIDIEDPVVVRSDLAGRSVFVGSRSGAISVVECR
jgi:WD40 repeat protein